MSASYATSQSGDSSRCATVAIVEDEQDVRTSLRLMVEASGEFQCVGSYSSGEEAVAGVPSTRPDILLADIRMPGMSGVECARMLKRSIPSIAVIFVSGYCDDESVSEASATGDEILLKPLALAECLATLRFHSARRRLNFGTSRLNNREATVMDLLANGLAYKQIAARLRWSLAVVKKVQHTAFMKMGTHNRTEATRRWLRF